jgi:alkylation response protein AidB-like acyl-CoA dehydrogenase
LDLTFTDEQQLLRETVRGLCQRHAGLDVVRQFEDDPIGFPDKFWAALGETGLLDMRELSMLDAAIVYEEFGRALSPSPHFASSVISAGILGTGGTDRVVVPAWLEPERGFGERGIAVRSEGGVLAGTKRHVPYAKAADELLVLARDVATGDVVYVRVDPAAGGVALTQQTTVASDTQYRIDFDGAAGEVIDRRGWAVFDAVMRDALILLAAQAVGGARYALDITVQYAKDRHQFDKPLGAFQAIAHYLADAVTAVDGAETLLWEAAWARDNDRSTATLAPMAKLFATQTFRDVTAMAQQVFGGVGFTVDYDIQLYFRRAKQLQISWWDTRYLEELIATEILDR